jgi:prepilin-type N-terminal cleavage/methylation domain-containing protein
MGHLRDKRGVTLLELMVVLAIIGVMMAVAVPSYYAWLPHLRVKGAARDVAEALQIARMKAVAKNNAYIVIFKFNADSPPNSFSMGPRTGAPTDVEFSEESNSLNDGWKGVELVLTDPSGTTTDAFTFNGYPGAVIFNSDGTASFNFSAVIGNRGAVYLRNKADISNKEDWFKVVVAGLTGTSTIQYFNGTQWVDE